MIFLLLFCIIKVKVSYKILQNKYTVTHYVSYVIRLLAITETQAKMVDFKSCYLMHANWATAEMSVSVNAELSPGTLDVPGYNELLTFYIAWYFTLVSLNKTFSSYFQSFNFFP